MGITSLMTLCRAVWQEAGAKLAESDRGTVRAVCGARRTGVPKRDSGAWVLEGAGPAASKTGETLRSVNLAYYR